MNRWEIWILNLITHIINNILLRFRGLLESFRNNPLVCSIEKKRNDDNNDKTLRFKEILSLKSPTSSRLKSHLRVINLICYSLYSLRLSHTLWIYSNKTESKAATTLAKQTTKTHCYLLTPDSKILSGIILLRWQLSFSFFIIIAWDRYQQSYGDR